MLEYTLDRVLPKRNDGSLTSRSGFVWRFLGSWGQSLL